LTRVVPSLMAQRYFDTICVGTLQVCSRLGATASRLTALASYSLISFNSLVVRLRPNETRTTRGFKAALRERSSWANEPLSTFVKTSASFSCSSKKLCKLQSDRVSQLSLRSITVYPFTSLTYFSAPRNDFALDGFAQILYTHRYGKLSKINYCHAW